MATTYQAYASLLGTVTNAAEAIGSVFTNANASVKMLDAFVAKASEEQRINYTVQRLDFIENAKIEHAEQTTKRKLQVIEFTSQSPVHQELFQSAYNRISDILDPVQPTT